ncbi:hypothetical protein SHIRM173S_01341 [Streptomyces hirsutus]
MVVSIRPNDMCMRAVNTKAPMASAGRVSTDGRARPAPMPSTAPATRKSAPTSEIGSHPRCVYSVWASTWTAPTRTRSANAEARVIAVAPAGAAARCQAGRGVVVSSSGIFER